MQDTLDTLNIRKNAAEYAVQRANEALENSWGTVNHSIKQLERARDAKLKAEKQYTRALKKTNS
jgi:hypothetical protein